MSPTTLRVFEHQTVCVGEPLRTAEGATVALSETQLDALARFNDAHAQRYCAIGYRRVTFQSYVGFMQVGRLGIEILPKADRGAVRDGDTARWQSLLLEMLRVAAGIRLYSPSSAAQRLGRSRLLDIIALRFVEELERLLHEGLAKGYVEAEANGSTFRGRLLVAEQLRENLARDDRFFVRYSTFQPDVQVNRILAAALDALSDVALASLLRARLATCARLFPQVRRVDRRPGLFTRLRPGRSMARYQDAIILARMILEQQAPELRAGREPVFALLFDMNVLWERYVAWLFQRAAPSQLEITAQASCSFWRGSGAPVRTVRPDLIVRDRASARVLLIADSKWKMLRERAPADDDLKQMFVYNELFVAPRSILVYPAREERPQREGEYVGKGHRCGTLELALLADLPSRTHALVTIVRAALTGLAADTNAPARLS